MMALMRSTNQFGYKKLRASTGLDGLTGLNTALALPRIIARTVLQSTAVLAIQLEYDKISSREAQA